MFYLFKIQLDNPSGLAMRASCLRGITQQESVHECFRYWQHFRMDKRKFKKGWTAY